VKLSITLETAPAAIATAIPQNHPVQGKATSSSSSQETPLLALA